MELLDRTFTFINVSLALDGYRWLRKSDYAN